MRIFRLIAGLVLCLTLLPGVSWATCVCPMPDMARVAHHQGAPAEVAHQAAAGEDEHAPDAPCRHECETVKAVKAPAAADSAMAVASAGASVPAAILPTVAQIALDRPGRDAPRAPWQTGPPPPRRTPVQLYTLMLN